MSFSCSRFSFVRDVTMGNFGVRNANISPEKTQFMKSYQRVRKRESFLQKTVLLGLLAISAVPPAIQRTEAAANVVVWDAGSRFADTIDTENRAGWMAVPTELFAFEAEPAKAASDPGYSGREY